MDFLTQKFIVFARRFGIEINLLNESIQEQSKTISNAANAHQQQTQPPVQVSAELQLPKTVTDAITEYSQKKKSGLEIATFVVSVVLTIATIGAFVSAAWYACIANHQLEVMEETLKETRLNYAEIQKQTAATQRTADATVDSVYSLIRPKVGFDPSILKPNNVGCEGGASPKLKDAEIYGALTNIGHSQADVAAEFGVWPAYSVSNSLLPKAVEEYRMYENVCRRAREQLSKTRTLNTISPNAAPFISKFPVVVNKDYFPRSAFGDGTTIVWCIAYRGINRNEIYMTLGSYRARIGGDCSNRTVTVEPLSTKVDY